MSLLCVKRGCAVMFEIIRSFMQKVAAKIVKKKRIANFLTIFAFSVGLTK